MNVRIQSGDRKNYSFLNKRADLSKPLLFYGYSDEVCLLQLGPGL